MPIFRVKSVKIYTGQTKFTRAPLVVLVTNMRYGFDMSLVICHTIHISVAQWYEAAHSYIWLIFRFLKENADQIVPYSWLPFGAGPRACIGINLNAFSLKDVFILRPQGSGSRWPRWRWPWPRWSPSSGWRRTRRPRSSSRRATRPWCPIMGSMSGWSQDELLLWGLLVSISWSIILNQTKPISCSKQYNLGFLSNVILEYSYFEPSHSGWPSKILYVWSCHACKKPMGLS